LLSRNLVNWPYRVDASEIRFSHNFIIIVNRGRTSLSHNVQRIPEVPSVVRNLGEGRQAGNRESVSYARPLGPSVGGGWIPPEKRRVEFDILYLSYFLIDDRIYLDSSTFIPNLLD